MKGLEEYTIERISRSRWLLLPDANCICNQTEFVQGKGVTDVISSFPSIIFSL